MSLDTAEVVVKRAYEYAEGVCNFIFQGGEPTLAGLEYFEYFVDLCKKYNTKNVKTTFSIQTNGYNVNIFLCVWADADVCVSPLKTACPRLTDSAEAILSFSRMLMNAW
jgi:sulfatase maturation enzyme AslB (radical SAM superfamily)